MSRPMKLIDVLIDEIKDLHNAETQLLRALPRMVKAASTTKLKTGFMAHWEQTKEHSNRLERAVAMLGATLGGKTCKVMKGLIEEGREKIALPKGSARDASLICAAQKMEHYEIAGYDSVRAFALQLGQDEVARLLEMTLAEETETDHKLTEIAKHINPLVETIEN
jgi:ferritin-like metal-binding protein YciE